MTAHLRPGPGALKGAASNFRLDGPSIALDPRIHAFRPDIADLALAGQVFATHYARPQPRRCVLPSAMMHAVPGLAGPAISQLLFGEEFGVIDISGGWAWGYSRHDHYVGYVAAEALGSPLPQTTHIVSNPLALVFAAPDIKSPLRLRLPMGARLAALETADNSFIRCDPGWLHPRHVIAAGEITADFATADFAGVAERLIGTPYLWGGRGGDGIDCSGLVQLALSFAGIPAPRDSDQQRDALGDDAPASNLKRGDLVFFPGHVGIMADATRIIHASAWWMRVAVEPLVDVINLLKAEHEQPLQAVRRLPKDK